MKFIFNALISACQIVLENDQQKKYQGESDADPLCNDDPGEPG